MFILIAEAGRVAHLSARFFHWRFVTRYESKLTV
jgi:hypothetical protein